MTSEKCKHCGNDHEAHCPWVKSIEYFEDGTIKRVEYMTPADYVTMPACVPYPVPQPSPIYPQPNGPVIPYYHNPVTCGGYPSGTIINSTSGSHSTPYNS